MCYEVWFVSSRYFRRSNFAAANITTTSHSTLNVIHLSSSLQSMTKINYEFLKLMEKSVNLSSQQPSSSSKKRYEFAINVKSQSRSKHIYLHNPFKPTYPVQVFLKKSLFMIPSNLCNQYQYLPHTLIISLIKK